jgi:hypothetical protein
MVMVYMGGHISGATTTRPSHSVRTYGVRSMRSRWSATG